MGVIKCSLAQVNLRVLLQNGQCFRWVYRELDGDWLGVHSHVLWSLKQNDQSGHIEYEAVARFAAAASAATDQTVIERYFQIHQVDLPALYADWCRADGYLRSLVQSGKATRGLPILAQQPFECLMSFICSQNNNIKRIAGMIERLCVEYGDCLEVAGHKYYDFPTVDSLAGADQSAMDTRLRELGFGYRAAYISKAAIQIRDKGGCDWLDTLRHMTDVKAKAELMALSGVGPKVADCVLLMSLGHTNVVPIVTHVWQITAQQYMPSLKHQKTITATVYTQIVAFYRQLFGPYAGWAQTVLFTAKIGVTDSDSNAAAADKLDGQKSVKTDCEPSTSQSKSSYKQKISRKRPLKVENKAEGAVRKDLPVLTRLRPRPTEEAAAVCFEETMDYH